MANYGGLDVGLEKEVWGDKHVESWVFDRTTYLHRSQDYSDDDYLFRDNIATNLKIKHEWRKKWKN